MIVKDILFSHDPFRVQIYNLPLATMSQQVRLQVGRRLGVVHEVDVDREGLGRGKCLHVRVDIELSKPLMIDTINGYPNIYLRL